MRWTHFIWSCWWLCCLKFSLFPLNYIQVWFLGVLRVAFLSDWCASDIGSVPFSYSQFNVVDTASWLSFININMATPAQQINLYHFRSSVSKPQSCNRLFLFIICKYAYTYPYQLWGQIHWNVFKYRYFSFGQIKIHSVVNIFKYKHF